MEARGQLVVRRPRPAGRLEELLQLGGVTVPSSVQHGRYAGLRRVDRTKAEHGKALEEMSSVDRLAVDLAVSYQPGQVVDRVRRTGRVFAAGVRQHALGRGHLGGDERVEAIVRYDGVDHQRADMVRVA
jgi:hypothetical protein